MKAHKMKKLGSEETITSNFSQDRAHSNSKVTNFIVFQLKTIMILRAINLKLLRQ